MPRIPENDVLAFLTTCPALLPGSAVEASGEAAGARGEERRALDTRDPSARRKPRPWLSSLAAYLKPVTLPPGKSLSERAPGLRFVHSGGVEVKRRRRALPSGAQVLGPGSVLGLREVARWGAHEEQPAEEEARVRVPSVLLELETRRFEKVFRRDGALLARLLAAHETNARAEELVRALSESPQLANAQDDDLFRLVECAVPVRGSREGTPLFDAPIVPDGFFVVLEGRCEIASSSGLISLPEPPTCVGLDNFLQGTPLPGTVTLRDIGEGALAFHIGREWFEHLLDTEMDFARAIARGCPDLLEPPPPPASHQVIVWGASEAGLPPWKDLGALLAERMAVHLHEHVLTVRVEEGAPPDEDPMDFRTPTGALNGWVATCRRPPTWMEDRPILPPSTRTTWWGHGGGPFAGRINVTLVDTSALDAGTRERVLDQLAREVPPDEPIKYVHLSTSRHPPRHALPDRVKCIQTGVLLPDRSDPAPRLLAERLLPRELKAARLGRSASLWARTVGRALRQRHVPRGSDTRLEWPMGTVRVRFPEAWLGEGRRPDPRAAEEDEAVRETFDRWARALTGRRVGLALGGGGPFGFVSIALLDRLDPKPAKGEAEDVPGLRLPIDLVSGSSFGAAVGAFYCVGGRAALDVLMRQCDYLLGLVMLSSFSSAILEWWADLQLGARLLDELEVPFFPVVTDADVGVEWDLRSGCVGRGIRASSSLPPIFGPTLIGNRRLLDGGLVANVPENVLRAEGVDILIAANPVSRIPPRSRSYPYPWVGPLLRQLNPWLRVTDGLRMLQVLGRLIGGLQRHEDGTVLYQPDITSATPFGFKEGPRIVERARHSLEVDLAVLQARTAWRRRLNNPLWVVPRGNLDEHTPAWLELALPLVFRDTPGGSRLMASSTEILDELAEYLHTHKAIKALQVRLTAPDQAIAARRARALVEQLRLRIFQKQVTVGEDVLLARSGGPTSRVELTVLETREVTDSVMREAADMMEDYRGHLVDLRRVHTGARMNALLASAAEQSRTGAPELSRLLALEATEYARPPPAPRASLGRRPLRVGRRPPAPEPRVAPQERPRPPPEAQALLDPVLRGVLDRHGACLRVLSNLAAIGCAAWSPDGRLLATGDRRGEVRLWERDPSGNEPWRTLETESPIHSVTALTWAGRGDLLAIGTANGKVRVVKVGPEALEPWRDYDARLAWHWGLLFQPGDALLLGPYRQDPELPGRHAALLELASGRVLPVSDTSVEPPRFPEVTAAAWAPDGTAFATAGGDEVGLWRVERAGEAYTVAKQGTFPLKGARSVAWHPRGQLLAIGGDGRALVIRSTGAGTKGMEMEAPGQVEHVAWSPDGRWLATAIGGVGALRIWNTQACRLWNVLQVEGDSLEGIAWNPMRRGIVATWGGNRARVWNAESGRLLATLTGHSGHVHQVAWSPDGGQLVTVSADATARVWDDSAGGPQRHATWADVKRAVEPGMGDLPSSKQDNLPAPTELPLEPGTEGTAWAFFHPKRPGLAAIPDTPPTSVRFWEGRGTAPRVKGRRYGARWSPDGRWVAVQERTRAVSIWTASGALVERLELDADLLAMAWHPTRPCLGLALFRDEGGPGFWSPGTTDAARPSSGRERVGLWDLAWSPSGQQLATASQDGWARIYESSAACENGRLLGSLRLVSAARRVAWSPPDGQFLATGDDGGVVGIWDSRGYDLVASPQERWAPIAHLVWNPRGTRLFSASEDGRGLIWRLDETGRWIIAAVLESEPVPLRWAAFSANGRWLVVMAKDGASLRLHAVGFETLVARVADLPGRDVFTEQERTHYLRLQEQRWRGRSRGGEGRAVH